MEQINVIYGPNFVLITTKTGREIDRYEDFSTPQEAVAFAFGYAEAVNSTPNTQAILIMEN